VTEGHPDKICDQVSDTVLDALLAQDPASRVACETVVNTGLCLITGEVTTSPRGKLQYPGSGGDQPDRLLRRQGRWVLMPTVPRCSWLSISNRPILPKV
jgi:hypothetical protein